MIRILAFALAAALTQAAVVPIPAAAETADLSPDDSAAVSRAVRYLNDISTLRARFVQISSNGAYAEGQMLLHRPGKMRFEYDPPHPALIIANGLTLLFYDRELKQASYLPLWETPLWFLIREEVELSDDVVVTKVEQERATLRVTIQDRRNAEAGAVTLVFADRPMTLKRWDMVDAQGVLTQVSLVNPEFGVEIDPDAFASRRLQLENLPTDRPER